ncbi:Voltage-gated hydrogen channel 1 [Halocaridina rubra]|uniref:Voltage-gated hydrogen channel 1 n=1 Tax=Halocaridina rubra TaxID=373956 RepID=A0AAN8WZ95_HALRR
MSRDSEISLSSEDEDPTWRRPGINGFRQTLRNTMMQTKYQLVVMGLVILDVVLVVGQLMLDLQGSHHTASRVLHYLSLAVLSIFFLEIIFKIFTYEREFFSSKFEMFDAVVVIVALILDIIYLDETDAHSGFGFIIILRLWRLVRIQNAMMVQVRRVEEKKLEREKQRRWVVEEELQRYKTYVATLQENAYPDLPPFENSTKDPPDNREPA